MTCRVFPLLSVLFLFKLCFVTVEVVECRSGTRSLVTREETLNDFLAWVARVGSKNHSASGIDKSARVREQVGNVITVDKSGGGQYTSVQAAVNAIPSGNGQRVVIQIAAGTYEEKVNVPSSKGYITFQGAGAGTTNIVWHDTADSSGSTQDSASVAINSDNFIARDISFTNSAPSPPSGSTDKQAVALRISGDQAAFYSCSFNGYQDTLFDDAGKHYFESCFIQGSVDFICGDGQSLYKGCELHALARKTESLTAQKRSSPGESTGFSFVNCRVTGVGRAYLGRAWGPYSRTVFAYTYMEDMIIPAGWYNWGDSSRDSKVFYGQYQCTGPGADESGRVGWSHELTAEQAAPFLSLSFIDGESWVEV